MTNPERDELLFLMARALLTLLNSTDNDDIVASLAVQIDALAPKMPDYCQPPKEKV